MSQAATVPSLVVLIENGIVAGVYFENVGLMYAVVDLDEATWGDDYVGVDYTLNLDDLQPDIAAAIRHTLEEDR